MITQEHSILKYHKTITDHKLLNDLTENILINCSQETIFTIKNVSLSIFCEFFSGSSIYNVLQAYHPKRFLLELIESCKENEKSLIKAYEILLSILSEINKIRMIDSDFLQCLGFLINSNLFNDRINEIYIAMINRCQDYLVKDLFDAYLSKLTKFEGNNLHIKYVITKFKEFYPFNKENFYKLALVVQGCELNSVKELIHEYLAKDKEKTFRDIGYILVKLVNDEHIEMIQLILEKIKEILVNDANVAQVGCFLNNVNQITTTLLYALQKIKNSKVTALILKILCCKKNDYNQTDVTQSKLLYHLIDQNLQNDLDLEIVNLLLKKGFNNKNFSKTVKHKAIDFVLKRFCFITTKECLFSIKAFLFNNSEYILNFVHDRDIFPDWLVNYYKQTNDNLLTTELAVFIFSTCANVSVYDKLQLFFKEIPDFSIFIQVFNQVTKKNKEFVFELLKILKTINKSYISENMSTYLYIAKLFQTPEIMKVLEESIDINRVLLKSLKTSRTPTKKSRFSKEKYKFLMTEYIDLLLYGIRSYSNFYDFFDIFYALFSQENIGYFCENKTKPIEKKLCEDLLCLYIFVELLEIYYDKNKPVLDFLQNFVKNAKVFRKLQKFFKSKKNREVLRVFNKSAKNKAFVSSTHSDLFTEWPTESDFYAVNSLNITMANDLNEIENLFNENNSLFETVLESSKFLNIYEQLLEICKNLKNNLFNQLKNSGISLESDTIVKINESDHYYPVILEELLENQ